FNMRLEGTVDGDRFRPHLWLDAGGLIKLDREMEPVEVSANGSVMLPLHPPDRLRGLRPRQRRRMPVVVPLRQSLDLSNKLGFGAETSYIDAHVLPQLETFDGDHQRDVSCLVVEYENEEMKVRTWVEPRTGRVICQEGTLGKDHWVME